MENLLGGREPSLIDGGKDTGTPTAAKWQIKKTKFQIKIIFNIKIQTNFSVQ